MLLMLKKWTINKSMALKESKTNWRNGINNNNKKRIKETGPTADVNESDIVNSSSDWMPPLWSGWRLSATSGHCHGLLEAHTSRCIKTVLAQGPCAHFIYLLICMRSRWLSCLIGAFGNFLFVEPTTAHLFLLWTRQIRCS